MKEDQSMLSRSSSAYQPLDSAATASGSGNPTHRRGNAIGIGEVTNGGGIEDEAESDIHEMTSIAVISQNPPGTGATPTISTLPMKESAEAGSGPGSKASRLVGGDASGVDLDFSYKRSRSEKTTWTNFHFIMCIGIGGFFVFWVVLLCRMYLPPEYQFWDPESKFYSNN